MNRHGDGHNCPNSTESRWNAAQDKPLRLMPHAMDCSPLLASHSLSRKPRKRKYVHFRDRPERDQHCARVPLETVVAPCSAVENGIDPCMLWYTRDDIAQFKATARSEARAVLHACQPEHKSEQGVTAPGDENAIEAIIQAFKRSITHAARFDFRNGNNTAASQLSYTTNRKSPNASKSSLSSHHALFRHDSVLNVPFHGSLALIGLEYTAHIDIYHNQRRCRKSLLQVLEDLQSPRVQCMFRKQQQQTNGEINEDLLPTKVLCRACENVSGPSILFAQYLGQAAAAMSVTSTTSLSTTSVSLPHDEKEVP